MAQAQVRESTPLLHAGDADCQADSEGQEEEGSPCRKASGNSLLPCRGGVESQCHSFLAAVVEVDGDEARIVCANRQNAMRALADLVDCDALWAWGLTTEDTTERRGRREVEQPKVGPVGARRAGASESKDIERDCVSWRG